MENFNGDGKVVTTPCTKIFLDKEICHGSSGIVVYKGAYPARWREVAVKRMSEDQFHAKCQGYENLDRLGGNCLHIVSLFMIEVVDNFIYAMLSLCEYDFHHLVKNEGLYADLLEEDGYPKPYLLDLMRNIVDGLQYLHDRRIIYGDLNPSHVLIYKSQTNIARLSVVGTCRRLAKDETSLRSDDTVSGTPGWRTPEQILNLPQTPAMDVFNLGCVLFFLLTRGKHPFGESENNVADGNIVNLSLVEHVPEAKDLISRLVKFEPRLRPKVSDVLRHPLFWNFFTRLAFLRDASKRANGNKKGARYIVEALERDAPRVFGGTFNGLTGPESIAEMEYNQQFSRISVVRELLHSIQSTVAALRCRALEDMATYLADPHLFDMEELDHYLRRRFPNLFMAVYDVMLDFCKLEDWFDPYLPFKRLY